MYHILLHNDTPARCKNGNDFDAFLIDRDLSYNQLTGEIPFNVGFLQVATLYDFCSFLLYLNM